MCVLLALINCTYANEWRTAWNRGYHTFTCDVVAHDFCPDIIFCFHTAVDVTAISWLTGPVIETSLQTICASVGLPVYSCSPPITASRQKTSNTSPLKIM